MVGLSKIEIIRTHSRILDSLGGLYRGLYGGPGDTRS